VLFSAPAAVYDFFWRRQGVLLFSRAKQWRSIAIASEVEGPLGGPAEISPRALGPRPSSAASRERQSTAWPRRPVVHGEAGGQLVRTSWTYIELRLCRRDIPDRYVPCSAPILGFRRLAPAMWRSVADMPENPGSGACSCADRWVPACPAILAAIHLRGHGFPFTIPSDKNARWVAHLARRTL